MFDKKLGRETGITKIRKGFLGRLVRKVAVEESIISW